MKPDIVLKPEFVEFVPEELEQRTLYVAAKYRTVVHLCCCGCGRKVVTPLSPVSWKLTFDGVSITLHPSIGSWNLPCQSHYWIEKNRVRWAPRWTPSQVEAGRATDERRRAEYYGEEHPKTGPQPTLLARNHSNPVDALPPGGFWGRLWHRLFG